MSPKNVALAAAALALAAACTPEFDPASQVDGLRVLALRAEPPEIAPAPAPGDGPAAAPDRAALSALVLRGDAAREPARKTAVVYLACLPAPGDPTPTPCVALAALRDPTAVLAEAARAACGAGGEAEPSIAFAGAEVCDAASCGPVRAGEVTLPSPELSVPAGYAFDALPPGAPARILGVQAVVLAFAIDATAEELAAGAGGACPLGAVASRLSELWAAREHVLATKRVLVRGPEATDPPNRNPAIEGIAADGAALAGGTATALAPGRIGLAPVLPEGVEALHEDYTKLDAAGAPIERAREEWVYSWFGTAGELEEVHTRGAEAQAWTVGAAGPAAVAVVARDLRGGVAWAVREVALGP